ncbi:hypothetical protein LEMLEM_LOCUS1378 [Lemmus lemmus]
MEGILNATDCVVCIRSSVEFLYMKMMKAECLLSWE